MHNVDECDEELREKSFLDTLLQKQKMMYLERIQKQKEKNTKKDNKKEKEIFLTEDENNKKEDVESGFEKIEKEIINPLTERVDVNKLLEGGVDENNINDTKYENISGLFPLDCNPPLSSSVYPRSVYTIKEDLIDDIPDIPISSLFPLDCGPPLSLSVYSRSVYIMEDLINDIPDIPFSSTKVPEDVLWMCGGIIGKEKDEKEEVLTDEGGGSEKIGEKKVDQNILLDLESSETQIRKRLLKIKVAPFIRMFQFPYYLSFVPATLAPSPLFDPTQFSALIKRTEKKIYNKIIDKTNINECDCNIWKEEEGYLSKSLDSVPVEISNYSYSDLWTFVDSLPDIVLHSVDNLYFLHNGVCLWKDELKIKEKKYSNRNEIEENESKENNNNNTGKSIFHVSEIQWSSSSSSQSQNFILSPLIFSHPPNHGLIHTVLQRHKIKMQNNGLRIREEEEGMIIYEHEARERERIRKAEEVYFFEYLVNSFILLFFFL